MDRADGDYFEERYGVTDEDERYARMRHKRKRPATPRCDHKHEYVPVVVELSHRKTGHVSYYLEHECSICGQLRREKGFRTHHLDADEAKRLVSGGAKRELWPFE